MESSESKKFDCKPPTFLLSDRSITFNGVFISRNNNFYEISQPKHLAKLQPVRSDVVDKVANISERARGRT